MIIKVNDDASKWFKDNFELNDGDALRFYGKVYGANNGFSLAVMKLEPTRPFAQTVVDGIVYYVEHGDAWYFEGKDLDISLDPKYHEPHYETH